MKQTDSSHYSFLRYMNLARWACYYYQIKMTLELEPKSVLEIGPGDGLFAWYMKKNGIHYESVDHADDITATHKISLGDEALPIADSAYDVVVAFQVLEHIPYEKFSYALSELKRVSKRYVFLDIPQFGFHINLAFKIPLVRYFDFHAVLPRPVKHVFDGFHYWEIGKHGYQRKRIRNEISKQLKILKEFSIYLKPGERFYLLEK